MKRIDHKKKSVGKVVTGMLIGSVVGATVGWLTAPLSGRELRHKIVGNGSRRSAQDGNPHPIPEVDRGSNRRSLQEKIKTSEGNVESRARELVEEVKENAGKTKKTVSRRRKTAST